MSGSVGSRLSSASTGACTPTAPRLNINEPLWNQDTFIGRLKHFFWLTDPRNIWHSRKTLESAKELVQQYKAQQEPLGTTLADVLKAKKLYESAYHPDSGEPQHIIGRMSCQLYKHMGITGCLLQFYKTNTQVVFFQWLNQSLNALINYTNRNAASDITNSQVMVAYVSATSCALVTALALKYRFAKSSSTLLQRWAPVGATSAANAVNIPLMRQSEIYSGVMCYDENGLEVVKSKYAAMKGIVQVVFSRIVMAAPGMILVPVIMENLEKRPGFVSFKPYGVVTQTLLVGCFLIFMTPVACALFSQKCSVTSGSLEYFDRKAYREMRVKGLLTKRVLYFNKGL